MEHIFSKKSLRSRCFHGKFEKKKIMYDIGSIVFTLCRVYSVVSAIGDEMKLKV